MILGIGTDIIEITRVGEALERHPERYRKRIYTQREQEYSDGHRLPLPHFAARWAAKESAVKALGTGFRRGIKWTDLEIINHPSGQPMLLLHDAAAEIAQELGVKSAHVTLSHNRDQATATVILASDAPSDARFDPFEAEQ